MVYVKQRNLNLIYEVIQQMQTFLFTDLEKISIKNTLKKWSFQSSLIDRLCVLKTSVNG